MFTGLFKSYGIIDKLLSITFQPVCSILYPSADMARVLLNFSYQMTHL